MTWGYWPEGEEAHMTRLRPPAVVKWAAGAMLAGAALTAGWGALRAASMDHSTGGMIPAPAWFGLAYGSFLAVAGSAPWVWMAWMALAGRGWARVWSVVFFDIYFVSVFSYVIKSRFSFQQSVGPGVAVGVGLELLVGFVALVLLWRPASSQFFSAAKQARTAP
jgi:hypothetical protein